MIFIMNKQKNNLLILKNRQDNIFTQMAGLLSSLSSPVRLKLIHFLSQQPLNVEVLSVKMDQSIANTSMHLRKMLKEKIVEVRGDGQKRFYSLAPSMFAFWESIQNFCEDLDSTFKLDVANVYGDIVWTKSLDETLKLLKAKKIVLLDVRPEDESTLAPFYTMQIDYLSISGQKLFESLNLIPKDKTILVLCRGRLCALSANASHELRKLGFDAYRFNESWFGLEQAFLLQGEKND